MADAESFAVAESSSPLGHGAGEQGFLFPTDQSSDARPDTDGSRAGVHVSTLASDVGRRQEYAIAYMVRRALVHVAAFR
jgi:Tfp pilus assembly protein PilX